MRDTAIRNLYPSVVSINNETEAFDKENYKVILDELLINEEVEKLKFISFKNTKLSEIETSYSNEISENISYMNTEFQADKDSRDLIVATLSGGNLPEGFFWQDINNDRVPMTYVELQGLSASILNRGQLSFIKKQDIKILVNNATTTEELESIQWQGL